MADLECETRLPPPLSAPAIGVLQSPVAWGSTVRKAAPSVVAASAAPSPVPRYCTRLAVRRGERLVLRRVEEVLWIEAANKWSTVHFADSRQVLREGLGRIARLLDPERFLRVSRFAVINLDAVVEIQPWFHGDYRFVIEGGAGVTSTRGFRDCLEQIPGLHRIRRS